MECPILGKLLKAVLVSREGVLHIKTWAQRLLVGSEFRIPTEIGYQRSWISESCLNQLCSEKFLAMIETEFELMPENKNVGKCQVYNFAFWAILEFIYVILRKFGPNQQVCDS